MKLPKVQLKPGDRVDVSVKITEEWQNQHYLLNAIIKEVKNDLVIVLVDKESTHSQFCPFFNGGFFYTQGFDILPLNS